MRYTQPAPPTAVGQRVRAGSYGGSVTQWMVGQVGTVVRFKKTGTPVIRFESVRVIPAKSPLDVDRYEVAGWVRETDTVSDRYGCFNRIDEDGKWINEEVEV